MADLLAVWFCGAEVNLWMEWSVECRTWVGVGKCYICGSCMPRVLSSVALPVLMVVVVECGSCRSVILLLFWFRDCNRPLLSYTTTLAVFIDDAVALDAPQQYNDGKTEEVEELLRKQKEETPNRIPYLICRRGVPGYVNLLYLPANR